MRPLLLSYHFGNHYNALVPGSVLRAAMVISDSESDSDASHSETSTADSDTPTDDEMLDVQAGSASVTSSSTSASQRAGKVAKALKGRQRCAVTAEYGTETRQALEKEMHPSRARSADADGSVIDPVHRFIEEHAAVTRCCMHHRVLSCESIYAPIGGVTPGSPFIDPVRMLQVRNELLHPMGRRVVTKQQQQVQRVKARRRLASRLKLKCMLNFFDHHRASCDSWDALAAALIWYVQPTAAACTDDELKRQRRSPILCQLKLCTACYWTALGVSRSAYTRARLKLLDALKASDGKIDTTAALETVRYQRQRPVLEITMAAFQQVIDNRGSNMPHKPDTTQLDGVHSNKALVALVNDVRMGVLNEASASRSTIARAMKAHSPDHKFITAIRTELAKCETCTKFDASVLAATDDTLKNATRAKKLVHLKEQEAQRHVFYRNHISACDPSKGLWSIVMDGMDQNKTHIPSVPRTSKRELDTYKLHVTGVLIAGAPIPALAIINYTERINDTNLNVSVLHRALLLNFEALAKDPTLSRPRRLTISVDNAVTNKGTIFFTYLAALVAADIFESVEVNYFLVGHGHNQIDQMFSRFAYAIDHQDAYTIDAMMRLLVGAYVPAVSGVEASRETLRALEANHATMKARSSDASARAVHECNSCGFIFHTRAELSVHLVDAHGEALGDNSRCGHCKQEWGSEVQTWAEASAARMAHYAASEACSAQHRQSALYTDDVIERPSAALAASPSRPSMQLYVEVIDAVHDVGAWFLASSAVTTKKVGGASGNYKFLVSKNADGVTTLRTRMLDVIDHARADNDADGYEPTSYPMISAAVLDGRPRLTVRSTMPTLSEPASGDPLITKHTSIMREWAEQRSWQPEVTNAWLKWERERRVVQEQCCSICRGFMDAEHKIGVISNGKDPAAAAIARQQSLAKTTNRKLFRLHFMSSTCVDHHAATDPNTRRTADGFWWADEGSLLTALPMLPDRPSLLSRMPLAAVNPQQDVNGGLPRRPCSAFAKTKRPAPSGGPPSKRKVPSNRMLLAVDFEVGMLAMTYSDVTERPFRVVEIGAMHRFYKADAGGAPLVRNTDLVTVRHWQVLPASTGSFVKNANANFNERQCPLEPLGVVALGVDADSLSRSFTLDAECTPFKRWCADVVDQAKDWRYERVDATSFVSRSRIFAIGSRESRAFRKKSGPAAASERNHANEVEHAVNIKACEGATHLTLTHAFYPCIISAICN